MDLQASSSNAATTGKSFLDKNAQLIFWMLCTLVTLLVYANSMFNGFVWDDNTIIVNNPVNRELSNIVKVLFSPDTAYLDEPIAYYRPLNRLSYVIDYQLFGLNPFFYHLENICIHLLNVLMLYKLSLHLMKNTEAAFVTAALFAVHPVNSEAVNFLSGRNNLNAVFFVLLSFLVYLYAQEHRKKYCLYLSALFFFLGLLCKEPVVMLLFVILFHQSGSFRAFRETIATRLAIIAPFVISTIVYAAMRQTVLSAAVWTDRGVGGFFQRILQNLYIIPKYLAVLLFPAKLNAHYSIPKDYLAHGALLAIAWISLVVLVILVVRLNRPVSRFGLIWIGINFIPISNLIPIPSAPMAERYMYLPAIGLWLIAGDFYAHLAAKYRLRKPLIGGCAVLLLLLGIITVARDAVWKNDESLFTSMIKAEPASEYGYYGLGCVFRDKGDLSQAQRLWERTLELEPRHSKALNQMGNIFLMQHFLEKAADYYIRSVEADSGNAEAQYNLAMTLEMLGRPAQALNHYEMFLKSMTPEYDRLIPAVRAKILELKGKSP